ncbi:hypothetical protein ARMGADRAFT_1079900 [Armillaria gallica]|uniref:DUF7330 domain-containing protein n=1 Tax=Armillaria gallica TaxID=47427 RepID=A0A2H3DRX0_ARMGA|nr:hypothetical protein ARMGADRAFT_1079900 [Armillaria gallica]
MSVQQSLQPSDNSRRDSFPIHIQTEKNNPLLMQPRFLGSQDTSPSRQPGNYTTIIRPSGPINESFLIDPTLSVPPSLLPPKTPYETVTEENGVKVIRRNNLNLIAKKGGIDADIEILNPKSNEETRCRIDIRSRGNITIHLHLPGTVSPDDPTRLVLPLCLMDVRSNSGDIYLRIPRNRLEGPLNVTTRHGVQFSPVVLKDLNVFNESENKLWRKKRKECFLGNFVGWSEGSGDVINLKAKAGRVFVEYIEEIPGGAESDKVVLTKDSDGEWLMMYRGRWLSSSGSAREQDKEEQAGRGRRTGQPVGRRS